MAVCKYTKISTFTRKLTKKSNLKIEENIFEIFQVNDPEHDDHDQLANHPLYSGGLFHHRK
jgi:hypothetical protein